jgi:hypothetical protein
VLAFDGQVLGGFDDFLASLDPWLREAKGLEAGLLGQAGGDGGAPRRRAGAAKRVEA